MSREDDTPGDHAATGGDGPPGAHAATFSFEYGTERVARVVAAAVDREVGEIDDDRSRATVERTGRTVTVRVDAADLVALRAATNTWVGLVDVAERTVDVADRHRGEPA